MAILGKISDEAYNSLKELRNTSMGLILKSWKHYISDKEEQDDEVAGARKFGSMFHTFLLESDVFSAKYVLLPEDHNGTTVAGKALNKSIKDAGRTGVKFKEYQAMCAMRESAMAHPVVKNILTNSENEGAFTAEIDGVPVKVKIDLMNKGYAFDVKTCEDASPEGFQKFIGNWKLERQAAIYSDVLNKNGVVLNGFGHIAFEKKPPYNVQPYVMTDDSIEIGRLEYKKALEIFKEHKKNPDLYGGYSKDILSISSPNWRFFGSTVNGV